MPLAAYFLGLIVLVLAAAAAAGIFLTAQANHDARSAAERNSAFAARIASTRIGTAVSSMRQTVDGVAETLLGRAIPTHLASTCTLSYSGTDAFPVGHVEIVRPNGVVVCSSRPHPNVQVLRGYAGAAWLRSAERQPILEAPVRDRATGRMAVVVAAPVGRQAVVAAFADLAPVAQSLAELYSGGHRDEFLVTSADGRTVLTRSIAPRRWSGRPLPPRDLPAVRGGTHVDVEGASRFYEESAVTPLGWRVYVGEDKASALAAGDSLRDRELWILAAGVAAVVLATLLIYRRVALPIRRVAAAVRASGPASTHQPVPLTGPAEIAGLAHDVNELMAAVDRELGQRRQLEQTLRHAQKMDALGRVVAGVAHDFNNLITVISGFTTLILRSLRGDDPVRQHAEEAARAAEGARMLIRQLLVFSRNDAPTPTVIDVNDVVGEMEKMLSRILGPTVELVARCAPAPVVVRADRGQLEQVVMNLSVNARDAMPDGGRVVVTTEQRVLDAAAAGAIGLVPGTYAVVGVTDTGTGIDSATRERLFEPFFTTKGAGEGTGLGLATCYGIVSQLGGQIQVESEVGVGSAFTVFLPLTEAPSEDATVPLSSPSRSADGETVLLVEDDDGLRSLSRIVLEEAGYQVLDAPAAEAGLDVAAAYRGNIDLLLTDGVMAAMSGRELADRFRNAYPDAKVVHMSGYEQEAFVGADAFVADAFLAKPFTPEALLATVRSALDQARRD